MQKNNKNNNLKRYTNKLVLARNEVIRRTMYCGAGHFLDVDVQSHDDPDGDDLRTIVHRSIVDQCHTLLVL